MNLTKQVRLRNRYAHPHTNIKKNKRHKRNNTSKPLRMRWLLLLPFLTTPLDTLCIWWTHLLTSRKSITFIKGLFYVACILSVDITRWKPNNLNFVHIHIISNVFYEKLPHNGLLKENVHWFLQASEKKI